MAIVGSAHGGRVLRPFSRRTAASTRASATTRWPRAGPLTRPSTPRARGRPAAAAAATDAAATDRTNAFVKADLKFHMDDSQALYRSSSTTGTALKI